MPLVGGAEDVRAAAGNGPNGGAGVPEAVSEAPGGAKVRIEPLGRPERGQSVELNPVKVEAIRFEKALHRMQAGSDVGGGEHVRGDPVEESAGRCQSQ